MHAWLEKIFSSAYNCSIFVCIVLCIALHAVQDLSFGSKEFQHTVPIDDILIANNIACSANGEMIQSYNFVWSWENTGQSIHKDLEHSLKLDDADEPFSLFGCKCGGSKKTFT
mmetsp:Transcript_33082/g.76239  ORF Transcript_33082/g.76239 Transcript_33082/m.76239 type:complete len:113 (+) Transcript_33082:2734-3072(+)